MATSVEDAAEIAAEYIYRLFDELGAEEEEGIEKACELYQMITGKKCNTEIVLGI